MDIFEKLIEGLIIQPLSQTEWESGLNENYKRHAESIEQQRNEMLEALIDDILGSEKNWLENWLDPPDLDPLTTDEEIIQKCHEANKNKISIIEKTCYPKTWEEIKELMNGIY